MLLLVISIEILWTCAERGMDIFGNDLDRCIVHINNTKSNITGYQFFHIVSSHSHNTNITLSITSFPQYFCFCKNGAYNCSIESKELIVPPGKTFNILSVIGVGLFNKPVPSRAETNIKVIMTLNFAENITVVTSTKVVAMTLD